MFFLAVFLSKTTLFGLDAGTANQKPPDFGRNPLGSPSPTRRLAEARARRATDPLRLGPAPRPGAPGRRRAPGAGAAPCSPTRRPSHAPPALSLDEVEQLRWCPEFCLFISGGGEEGGLKRNEKVKRSPFFWKGGPQQGFCSYWSLGANNGRSCYMNPV